MSHCLDFDVVSQGDSIEHAFKMGMEATRMVLAEDLSAGREPHARRAPQRYWDALYTMLQKGRKAPAADLLRKKKGAALFEMWIEVPTGATARTAKVTKKEIALSLECNRGVISPFRTRRIVVGHKRVGPTFLFCLCLFVRCCQVSEPQDRLQARGTN